ncbi:unnamed protein product [Leptidea sinapis]|uniref:Uncharacterized protein n=1 Tax=Leptidea sinapis TaxID=189913 RepID=A0A5E4QPT0_9NEOP|nr:unnamed protein product [Leptidea sinapis]
MREQATRGVAILEIKKAFHCRTTSNSSLLARYVRVDGNHLLADRVDRRRVDLTRDGLDSTLDGLHRRRHNLQFYAKHSAAVLFFDDIADAVCYNWPVCSLVGKQGISEYNRLKKNALSFGGVRVQLICSRVKKLPSYLLAFATIFCPLRSDVAVSPVLPEAASPQLVRYQIPDSIPIQISINILVSFRGGYELWFTNPENVKNEFARLLLSLIGYPTLYTFLS